MTGIVKEICKFGKKAVEHGLVSSHFGNISVRVGESMYITRSGSMLDELSEKDIVKVPISGSSPVDLIASSELKVHRMIYQNTSAMAIFHTHSPFAVVISIDHDEITPYDSEGQYFLHTIPVVTGGIGTEELGKNLAEALKRRRAAIAKGHGVFAIGKMLEEAFVNACMVEHSCKVIYYYSVKKLLEKFL